MPVLYTDTTDVKMIRAVLLEGGNAFIFQCMFVTGSDAIGCMVVLHEIIIMTTQQYMLTREGMHKIW